MASTPNVPFPTSPQAMFPASTAYPSTSAFSSSPKGTPDSLSGPSGPRMVVPTGTPLPLRIPGSSSGNIVGSPSVPSSSPSGTIPSQASPLMPTSMNAPPPPTPSLPIPPLVGGLRVPPPMPLGSVDGLANVDFSSMPVPEDTWMAVQQLEAALEGVRFGVEHQLNVIEDDTDRLESMYAELRSRVANHELTHGIDGMRSLLVCYFPREANKEMIRQAFSPYGPIDSVYLVHKDGKPACYGFVNFHDHASAARALAAANSERVELVDKRNVIWHVKAEWTMSSDIPKKPKKKRGKKKDEPGGKMPEESPTPPVALNRALKGYHPKMTLSGLPQHARIPHTLSYTVPTVPQVPFHE